MRLLVHLLKTDMRRFRGFIAIWIALVAVGVVLYAVSPTLVGETRLFAAMQTIAGLLWLARQLFRVILVALIVQADPTVGSTAFWMTRPVSPKLLFASKVLLIFGLTVGLPAAGDLVLGLVYHVPLRDIGVATLQTALANGTWATVLMTLAVPTRNLAQFAAACGVAILCVVLAPIWMALLATTRPRAALGRSGVASDPLILVVAAVILCSFLAGAWLVQYIRRNRRESVPVGVAGVCLAIGFATMTEPPLVSRQIEPPSWARAATLRLRPAPPNISRGTESVSLGARDRTSFVVARGRVELPELPPGWFAGASLREATVLANGRTITSTAPTYLAGATLSREAGRNWNATQMALGEALGVPRVSLVQAYDTDSAILFVVPDEGLARLAPLNGSYRGRFQLQLMHAEALAALPLAVGASFQDGAYRVTIDEVSLDDGLLTIRVEGSSVPTIVADPRRPRYDFYLRNRAQGEALGGAVRQARGSILGFPPLSGLVDLANVAPGINRWAEFLTFRGIESLTQPEALTREWLGEAEMVVVRTTNAGAVDSELAVDDFRWGPSSQR